MAQGCLQSGCAEDCGQLSRCSIRFEPGARRCRSRCLQQHASPVVFDRRGTSGFDTCGNGVSCLPGEVEKFLTNLGPVLGRIGLDESRRRAGQQIEPALAKRLLRHAGRSKPGVSGPATVSAERDRLTQKHRRFGITETTAIAADLVGFQFDRGIAPQARLPRFTFTGLDFGGLGVEFWMCRDRAAQRV